jgi:hypothetical protein
LISGFEAAFPPPFAAGSTRIGTLGSRDDVPAETSRTISFAASAFAPFRLVPPVPVAFETVRESLFEPAVEPLTLRDDPRAGVSFAIERTG